MSVNDFADILTRLTGYTKHIYLHVLGEPTLHPALVDLLAISYHQGFSVNLTTNGSLIARNELILLTSPAIRQINISLHSFVSCPELRKFEYLEQIRTFLPKSQARKILVNLRLWDVQNDNQSHKAKFDTDMLNWLTKHFDLSADLTQGLEPGLSLTLAPKIFLSRERQFNWPQLTDVIIEKQGSCRGLRDHIAILVDGSVVPCCLDADGVMGLGNIHNQSLANILAQSRAQKICRGFRQHQLVEELCQGCDYRRRFR